MTTVTVLQDKVIAVEVSSGFPLGNGVPNGGLAGQILAKASNTNYDTEWSFAGGGSGVWGGITGDLTNQADLQAALDAAGRVYVQTSQPGTDTEDGDLWYDPTTELLRVKSSGSWSGQTLDDGQY